MNITPNSQSKITAPAHSATGCDTGRAALELRALNGYKSGTLSEYEVQVMLGFSSRFETQNWLGRNGVHMQYSLEDLEADRKTMDELRGR